MDIYRNPAPQRRGIDYVPNHITVDQTTAWYVRFSYRILRRQGASIHAARSALYNMLFQAHLSRPEFTSGNASDQAVAS